MCIAPALAQNQNNRVENMDKMPIYRVNVVAHYQGDQLSPSQRLDEGGFQGHGSDATGERRRQSG
jgi:hypothetical protein